MDYRIENMTFREPHKALLQVIYKLLMSNSGTAIIRVSDEDKANALNTILQEAVDRIKIEFDSAEYGPNPIWTPSKLTKDDGKVILAGPYEQGVHTKGFVVDK